MEEWAIIQSHPNYAVSIYGEIKRIAPPIGTRNPMGLLSQQTPRCGYPQVVLYGMGKPKACGVHRLVATLFVNNPHGKPEVNHIDGNKKNNSYLNLEWVTRKENISHATAIGHTPRGDGHWTRLKPHLIASGTRHGSTTRPGCMPKGEGHYRAKLRERDVVEMRDLRLHGFSLLWIAQKYGVSMGGAWEVIARRTWKHVK